MISINIIVITLLQLTDCEIAAATSTTAIKRERMEQQWSDKTSTWFRSLKLNASSRPNANSRLRSYRDQLPKLPPPPPPEETLYPTAAATNHSRLALPPLLSTRSACNSSKTRAQTTITPLQSWLLLPAVSSASGSHNHKPTSTSSSKSSSTCSSSARLPPLHSQQSNNKVIVTRRSGK